MFVYGTLREGGSNRRLVEPYLLTSRPHAVPGRLYDAGDYPALVLDERETGLVFGEVLTVTEAALEPLDELEDYFGPGHPDNLYDRVQLGDGVWVYVWPQEKADAARLPLIEGGDWIGYAASRGRRL